MPRFSIALFALFFSFAPPIMAGKLDETRAQAHLHAIASGDMETLMRDYVEDAYLDWVGGPLDGRYQGKAAIRAVWQKFIDANAGNARPAKFSKLEAYSHPMGASIEASAEYGGATPVKVWHVLTYREGKLTTELWQVTPTLVVAP